MEGIDEYDYVFQHLNNEETKDAVAHWSAQGRHGKVIGYSSGGGASDYRGLPFLPGLGSASDFFALDWSAVPANFDQGAEALTNALIVRRYSILPSIAILCQGYLAAQAKNGSFPLDSPVTLALAAMGWQDDFRDYVLESTDTVRSAEWWLKALGFGHIDTRYQLRGALERDLGEAFNPSPLSTFGRFVTTLHDLEDFRNPEDIATLYLEIAAFLRDRPGMEHGAAVEK
jgi:hypothetical protein